MQSEIMLLFFVQLAGFSLTPGTKLFRPRVFFPRFLL